MDHPEALVELKATKGNPALEVQEKQGLDFHLASISFAARITMSDRIISRCDQRNGRAGRLAGIREKRRLVHSAERRRRWVSFNL